MVLWICIFEFKFGGVVMWFRFLGGGVVIWVLSLVVAGDLGLGLVLV